ncbi:MAG: hypothetical protein ABI587_08220 [Gemmatimonadales bacterium]
MRLIYRIHKWIGVSIGLVMIMWIVTGIMATGGGGGRGGERRGIDPDFTRATLSPAQAVLAAVGVDSEIAPITQLSVERLGARIIYRLTGARGRAMLLDAGDGTRVVVDEAMAREVALLEVPMATIGGPTLIEKKDAEYPQGDVPVWRVRLGGKEAGVLHISATTGQVTRVDPDGEWHRTVMGLHTFRGLRRFIASGPAINALLIVVSVISLVGVATGYYLSLPKAWRLRGRDERS